MSRRYPVLLVLAVLLAVFALPVSTQKGQLGYYRFPALSGDTVVFTAEGDLWRVGASGGIAQRLTTHPEEESRPAISPDGKTVAYSATYEGPGEVYTLPLDGGVPVRRTHDASRGLVVGWTPGGEMLFATRRHSTLPEHAARAPRPEDRRAHASPARAGERRRLRRQGRHALLHAPPLPGQPHAALQGRHGAEPLEAAGGRRRGGRRSPPTTPAPARRRCRGTAASTSSATATGR